MRHYNILHLISSGGLYGAERVILELAERMQSDHCHITIGVIQSIDDRHLEIAKEAERLGVNVKVFACSGKLGFTTVFKISDFIKENKINLLHSHGYKSNFYGLLATRKCPIPIITTNHSWLTSYFRLKIYYRVLDSRVMRFFDRIVAVSEEVQGDMVRSGIDPKKITIIDNGLNIERLSPALIPDHRLKATLNIPEKNKVIGAIGRFEPEKGFTYLLKAACGVVGLHKDVTFLIVGNGPIKESLVKQANDLGISDRVVFAGYRTDIPQLFSIMDTFVLSSIKEGLPMVILEAMAAKRPIIATRVGAVPKVIHDGENGLLVDIKDVTGLQSAICRLLENPDEADRLAQSGYDTVKKSYSSESMCQRYLELYQSC